MTPLLAIPFFTFMGLVLERSRMAEDLLDTIGQLFGTLRGGLAFRRCPSSGALLAAPPASCRFRDRHGPDFSPADHDALTITTPVLRPAPSRRPARWRRLSRHHWFSSSWPTRLRPLRRGHEWSGAFFPAMINRRCICALSLCHHADQAAMGFLPCRRKRARGQWRTDRSFVILAIAGSLFLAGLTLIRFRRACAYETRVVWFGPRWRTIIPYGFALINRLMKLGYLSRWPTGGDRPDPRWRCLFWSLAPSFLGIATPTEGGRHGRNRCLDHVPDEAPFWTLKTPPAGTRSTAEARNLSLMFILIAARVLRPVTF